MMKGRAHISLLENESGEILSSEENIEMEVLGFYSKLYENDRESRFVIDGMDWSPIDDIHRDLLEVNFSEEEIFKDIQGMGNMKSPGPDGMTG